MTRRVGPKMVSEDDAAFVQFWEAFPRRVAKKDARVAWAQLNPSAAVIAKIMGALEWQVGAYQWDGVKADYAPYPASWLRAERWTDERRRELRKPQAGEAAMTVLETLLGDVDG